MSPLPSEPRLAAGILCMLAAMVILPFMDATAKILGAELPPIQIAWGRQLVQMLLMLPVVLWLYGRSGLISRPVGPQTLRGLVMAVANLAFFTAVVYMPIADALAIFFVSPLITTAASAIFLKEPVGPRRWVAVVIGLVGALIIIRPGFGVFGPAAILPIVTACLFSAYLLLTRSMSVSAPAVQMNYWTAVSGFVIFSLIIGVARAGGIADLYIAPDARQWAMIAAIGAISTVGHFLLIQAFIRVPAATLAPLNYAEIVGAVGIGWWWFNDFPDLWSWVGIAVIVASGLFVWMRERVQHAPSQVSRRS